MRMGFGLVSLLVVVGIIAVWFSMSASTTSKSNKEMRETVEPMVGRGPDGESAEKSIQLEPKMRGGQVTGLVVKDVTPGGYFDHYFKLKAGDIIEQIGETPVSTYGGGAEAAFLQEAVTNQHTIVVLREEQRITLTPNSDPNSGTGGGGVRLPGVPQGIKIPTH